MLKLEDMIDDPDGTITVDEPKVTLAVDSTVVLGPTEKICDPGAAFVPDMIGVWLETPDSMLIDTGVDNTLLVDKITVEPEIILIADSEFDANSPEDGVTAGEILAFEGIVEVPDEVPLIDKSDEV